MLKILLATAVALSATAVHANTKEITCTYDTAKTSSVHTIIYNSNEEFSTWTEIETKKKNGKTRTTTVNTKTNTSPTGIQLVYIGVFINRVTVSRETLDFSWTQATTMYPDMMNTVQQGSCTVRELERKMAF
jgi:hypothetical protein